MKRVQLCNALRNFLSEEFLFHTWTIAYITRGTILKFSNTFKIRFIVEDMSVFYTYALWAGISFIVFAWFFEIIFPILPNHFTNFWAWSWFGILPLQLKITLVRFFCRFYTRIQFLSCIKSGKMSKVARMKKLNSEFDARSIKIGCFFVFFLVVGGRGVHFSRSWRVIVNKNSMFQS